MNYTVPEAPKDNEESILLQIVDDYLKNGGSVPSDKDEKFLLRMVLGGVRATYRQSAQNSNALRLLWGSVVVIGGGLVTLAATTAAQHTSIWDAIRALQVP